MFDVYKYTICISESDKTSFLLRFWKQAGIRDDSSSSNQFTLVIEILLMEEIPNNHLGCIKPWNYGINYQPQLVSQISSINSIEGVWKQRNPALVCAKRFFPICIFFPRSAAFLGNYKQGLFVESWSCDDRTVLQQILLKCRQFSTSYGFFRGSYAVLLPWFLQNKLMEKCFWKNVPMRVSECNLFMGDLNLYIYIYKERYTPQNQGLPPFLFT